jgi:uncharacterized protein YjbI with pentapeptide repeats
MKKNTLRLMIIGCVVMVLLLALPSQAQDDWPEDCQLPDLEEAMNAANAAQADGDVAAFVDILAEANRLVHDALQDCLEAAVEDDANLQGADLRGAELRYANLEGADLQGAYLRGAHLLGVDLHDANLQGADMYHVNLQEARLSGATMLGVDLNYAYLQYADLEGADLQGAHMRWAVLAWADLREANLRGANMDSASLHNAVATDAILDENTILPDAVWDYVNQAYTDASYWTPDTDMARFTDAAHPDFWAPCVRLGWTPYCEDSD